jgi:hypothetical protein
MDVPKAGEEAHFYVPEESIIYTQGLVRSVDERRLGMAEIHRPCCFSTDYMRVKALRSRRRAVLRSRH